MKVSAGVTLIELMVVILIISVLLALGVPSYRYVSNSSRVSSEVNALLGDLQYARSEAIREGQSVTICPSTDQATCAGTNTWHTGWIVVGGGVVQRVQQQFPNANDSFVSDNNVNTISFNREGFASTQPALAAGTVTIKLTTVPNTTAWTRCVEVVVGGSLTTQRYNEGNCK